jgi:tetratricopeptide (TPR) repeat protein
MRTRAVAAFCLTLLMVSACAPKTVSVPAVSTPKFPDFITPRIPPSLAATPAAANQERGWLFLQAGDFKSAEREFVAALTTTPAFYPAETALGYLELARKDPKAALTHFDRALDLNHVDVAALVGRGQSYLALDRESDALPAFEAAVAADSSLIEIRRRVEVLRFRVLEKDLSRARQAARAGRLDEATRVYLTAIASSPDSPFLYRELAAVERQNGDLDTALEHFRRATALDTGDADSLVQMGDILSARGDLEGAAKAYGDAIAIEPRAEVEAKLESTRERAALARLPAEYRAIGEVPQITRGDLAALIGIRLAALLQADRRRDAVVVTDVRTTHWAATWIMSVARGGVMEPFANHTFQPRAIVRRTDLAQAVSRLLARIAMQQPERAKAWESARLKFSDLSAGHLAYPAASAAVASGVLKVGPEDGFQPSRAVSGAEAVEAIERIEALADLRSERRSIQR